MKVRGAESHGLLCTDGGKIKTPRDRAREQEHSRTVELRGRHNLDAERREYDVSIK
jgi:hypothetical protein